MKMQYRLIFSAIFSLLLTAGCGTSSCCCKKNAAAENVKKNTQQDEVRLLLPEKIYAVPGIETNIYFENAVRVINPDNYVFNVYGTLTGSDTSRWLGGAFGRCDAKRWRYTPTAKEVGSHKLIFSVIGNRGEIVRKELTVVVSPADAGKGKNISMLIVGDSLTDSTVYPRQILTLANKSASPVLKLVGSHAGSGRVVQPGGVAHEGYSGWRWSIFNTKWMPDNQFKKLTSRRDIIRARSPFLAMKDGKLQLDIQDYFDRRNGGKPVDVITFQLGVNDIFAATDQNVEEQIDAIFAEMDKLLAAFRKAAPDAVIGVGIPTAGCFTQDGFGNNYRSLYFRWQYKKNQHRLAERMMEKFAKHNPYKVRIIPAYLNLDCENNFPAVSEKISQGSSRTVIRQSNGVHPSPDGYRQLGDSFYCWLKAVLHEQQTAPQATK